MPNNKNESDAQLLYSKAQTSKMLGISQRTLFDWTKRGLIQALKVGQTVRYDITDIRAFIVRQKATNN